MAMTTEPRSDRDVTAIDQSTGRVGDVVFAGLARSSGLLIMLALAGVAVFLVVQGSGALGNTGDAVYGKDSIWGYVWPLLFGTLLASVIAMAGDEVRIARAGFLMIHNTWIGAAGDLRGHRGTGRCAEQNLGVQQRRAQCGVRRADTGQHPGFPGDAGQPAAGEHQRPCHRSRASDSCSNDWRA